MTIGVIFPGQGSQHTGMLKELGDAHAVVADVFAEASDVFGQDLWTLAQNGPDEVLADTRVTQPLMFTADIAVWRALRNAGLSDPSAVAGHSLGEFAALVAAEAISFSDGCKLVKHRAQLMASAVPEGQGGMAALIGLTDEDVEKLCDDMKGSQILQAVNFNAPGQVAISGHLDVIEKAVIEAKVRGARKAVVLPVSVPNHSSLMQDAGAQLVETINTTTFSAPKFPVVQNAAAAAPADVDALVSSLKKHVYNPVQWTRSVQTLRDQYGVTKLLESGPSKVLTGLSKRIDRGLPCYVVV